MKFLATGDKILVAGNYWRDVFWRVNTRTGQRENRLGKLLMKVREDLKNGNQNKFF